MGKAIPSLLFTFQVQDVWPRFAAHYSQLAALPRRVRRVLQRQWKQSLSGIALLLAMGAMPAGAATIPVNAGCSLIDAITAANTDAVVGSCPAGSGADTIVLPAGSTQTLSAVHNTTFGATGLPVVTSLITIEGNNSTILRSAAAPPFRIFAVSNTGNLTLNQTIVSGGVANIAPPGDRGAGVLNYGVLFLTHTTILGNAGASSGGGLWNSGVVVMTSSNLLGNSGVGAGGVLNDSSGVMVVTGSTIADNFAHGGGGIINGGLFIATDSTITHNGAAFLSGGGASNSGTFITLNSTISNNSGGMGSGGGGLENFSTGAMTLINSTVSGNSSAGSSGGGGARNAGVLTLLNSTVSGNQGSTRGGGISNTAGTLSVLYSLIADNTAFGTGGTSIGGGLYNANAATAVVLNSTISGNEAGSSLFGRGGGVFNRGVMIAFDTTVTDNTASSSSLTTPGSGGGMQNSGSGILILARTLIAGNRAGFSSFGPPPVPEVVAEATSTLIADNYNLFGFSGNAGVSGFVPGATDIVPSVPLSAILNTTLADNGGPTLTHALVTGSPAVDASPVDAFCTDTDQRGALRPYGIACDIGAFELGSTPPSSPQ